jgi:1-acyl-sn-glycerol-3-phosphate acyltransferase
VERQAGEVSSAPGPTTSGLESVANFSHFFRFLQVVFLWIYGPLAIAWNHVVFGIRFRNRRSLKQRKSPCILVSNHSLYVDPAILIHAQFPGRSYYTGLKSHFANPVGGMFLRLIGGIPIPGAFGMKTAETTVRTALEGGHCVHFFPEGEMTHLSQEIAPFIGGAFYLALRIGVPIVPVTLVHWPRRWFGRPISRYFLRLKCVVGEPVEATRHEGESDRQAAKRVANEVRQIMIDTITSEQPKPTA